MLSANETQAWNKIGNKNNPLQFAGKYYFAFILICADGKLRYKRKASGTRKLNSNKVLSSAKGEKKT